MISKNSLGLMAGALMFSLGATLAFAALSGDDAIKARQACMKSHGQATFRVMAPMVKGEKPYDGAAVQAALASMDKDCAGWADYWPADSMTSTALKTRALDTIWKDPKDFDAKANAFYQQFLAVKATKDEAGFKAAFPAFGKTCGDCHEKYRGSAN